MSLGRYSVGVDFDQSQINTGTDQMINTFNDATSKVKDSLAKMVSNLESSLSQMSETMSKGSIQATNNLSDSFEKMDGSITNSMNRVSSSVSESTSRVSSSLNGLASSVNKTDLKGMATDADGASKNVGNLGSSMQTSGTSASFLSDKMRMVRQHLEWIATGTFLSALVGIPAAMMKASTETETLTQKLRQNLEMSEQYHNNAQQLDTDLKTLTTNAQTMGVGFATSATDVMESMQILSRRFKDVESISYLTSVALTMNKLDFVDLKKASSDLEAVMLQFGLTAQGTKGFLNDFSIAVHTARITGTDLMDALMRSGSSFKGFNMDSREATAAIAALSTETARTGSTIGNTFKSITANFSMKKAIEALDSYNIKLYDVNENGMKVMREGTNVFAELQNLYAKLDDEGKSKLSLAIAGGKFQVNAMSSFLADANNNFSKILGEMQTKSSDATTKQLLAAGMDTFSNKIKSLQSALTNWAKTMGDEVTPALKNITDKLTTMVTDLSKHQTEINKVIGVLTNLAEAYIVVRAGMIVYSTATAIVAAAQTAMMIATALLNGETTAASIGMAAYTLTTLATIPASLAAIIATDGLAAAFEALWVAIEGPVAIVIIAITALIAIVYEMYTNWNTILPALKNAWNTCVDEIADIIYTLRYVLAIPIAAMWGLHEAWVVISKKFSDLWTAVGELVGKVVDVIERFLTDALKAFGGFGNGVGTAMSNIGTILYTWAYNSLPEWGRKVLDFFNTLGEKLSSITKSIGDTIRNNLKLDNPEGGDFKPEDTDTGGGGESPFEKEQREAQEQIQAMIANNSLGDLGGGGGAEPDTNNQLGSGGGKGKKSKSAKEKESDDEYNVAKREYEAEISDEEYTAAQKLEIYHRLLDGKASGEKENHDYIKGLGKLTVEEAKEERELKNAQLDLEIAEGKEKNEDYYNRKIALLQNEVENEKEGSVARIQAEIKVVEAKKELLKFQQDQQQQVINQEKQSALTSLNTALDNAKKLKETYQMTQLAYDNYVLAGEDTRYQIELSALEKTKALYSQDQKEAAKVQTEITKLYTDHMKTRVGLEQNLYNETHKYQLAAMEGFRTGMESVLNSLLQWNATVKTMIRNLGESIIQSTEKTWVTGVVNNMSKGAAKMLGLANTEKSQQTTAETTKQNAITAVATAGENTRLLAMKTSVAASTTVGAAGATAMVEATTAAFTATLAMIQATAAAIATILPSGPGIAAEITAGVATGTAALTAAGATATASIASLSIPAFAEGTMGLAEDTLSIVHANEIIIPAKQSNAIKQTFAQGGGNSLLNGNSDSSGNTHVTLNASAVDTTGLKPLIKKMGKDLVNTLDRQKRNFNTGKKGW